MTDRTTDRTFLLGCILTAGGIALCLVMVIVSLSNNESKSHEPNGISVPALSAGIGAGVVFAGLGIMLILGPPKSLTVKGGPVEMTATYFEQTSIYEIEQQELPESAVREKRQIASEMRLPDRDAPPFSVVNDFLEIGAIPLADPNVPMYLLDANYRIIDWNIAFSLAFDRTMEGRRGMSVSEWIFFLENFVDVLDHGAKAFADPDNLPKVDVETVRFKSRRYGAFSATKRSFQIPKDDQSLLGWITTLALEFPDDETAERYNLDLTKLLRMDLVWSEYSLSYDAVLMNTKVYPELIKTLLGETGELKRIPAGHRVLDLGAGTGNLTYRLAEPSEERLIFALENNRAMLDVLRRKCRRYLRTDNRGPGVLAIKQDITSLHGLSREYFDVVLLNNVSYALDDPASCLREIRDVVRPGGEIRLSGPQKKTNLSKLLKQIKRDLETAGKFDELAQHYARLEAINRKYLDPVLRRWTVEDVKGQLKEAGFSRITHARDNVYAGQSMLIRAVRE